MEKKKYRSGARNVRFQLKGREIVARGKCTFCKLRFYSFCYSFFLFCTFIIRVNKHLVEAWTIDQPNEQTLCNDDDVADLVRNVRLQFSISCLLFSWSAWNESTRICYNVHHLIFLTLDLPFSFRIILIWCMIWWKL